MSKQPNEKTGSVNRRSFIRGLSASGGIATGLTGVATAKASKGENKIDEEFVEKAKEHLERREKLKSKYDDPEQVRGALRKTGGELLEKMATEGYLQSASLDNLKLESTLDTNAVQPAEASQGVAVTVLGIGETLTALIMVSKNTENYEMGIYVQPEAQKRYAIISPKDGSQVTYLGDTSQKTGAELQSSETEVETQDTCSTYTECNKTTDGVCHIDESAYCTHVWYEEIVHKCCQGLGCWVTGKKACVGNGHNKCHNHEGPLCCCV